MSDYFSTEERKLEFLKEAESWLGTPFRPYCAVKGRGVDCVRFIGALYARVGAIPLIDWGRFPKYNLDWSAHNEEPILEEALEALGLRYRKIEKEEALDVGDVLAFAPGKVVHHLAAYCGRRRVIHSLRDRRVDFTPSNHPTLKRLHQYTMRPTI